MSLFQGGPGVLQARGGQLDCAGKNHMVACRARPSQHAAVAVTWLAAVFCRLAMAGCSAKSNDSGIVCGDSRRCGACMLVCCKRFFLSYSSDGRTLTLDGMEGL